jgi:NAD(P)-dependent dehydrogenase (short-subunit alcohol dehydrogenase family)
VGWWTCPPTVTGLCAGRVALVTGASQGGTGTAIALRLAAEGARVAVTARSQPGLEATLERIRAVGGSGLALPADLADPSGGRETLVARVEAELGPIDILVNHAAMGGYKPFEEWTPAQLEAIQQVNVWAPWLLMSQVVPGMRDRGSGWVLNLTSFSGELPPGPPFPTNKPATAGSAYGSTKAALNRLTLAVASETYGQGIAVNALTPQAAIATPGLLAAGWVDESYMEPLETMAEAALALVTGDPAVLTGRIAYSLQLLAELDRPVRDLMGDALVTGWQPADLGAVIAGHARRLEGSGWPSPFTFGRPSSPGE